MHTPTAHKRSAHTPTAHVLSVFGPAPLLSTLSPSLTRSRRWGTPATLCCHCSRRHISVRAAWAPYSAALLPQALPVPRKLPRRLQRERRQVVAASAGAAPSRRKGFISSHAYFGCSLYEAAATMQAAPMVMMAIIALRMQHLVWSAWWSRASVMPPSVTRCVRTPRGRSNAVLHLLSS